MMNEEKEIAGLIGRRVSIVLTEPWDVISETGADPFIGTIEAIDFRAEPSLLIVLDPGFIAKAKPCTAVIVSARHHGTTVQDIVLGSEIFCNLVDVTTAQPLTSEEKFNSSFSCRSGHMIGDIRLLK
jgi:hypothetical protein